MDDETVPSGDAGTPGGARERLARGEQVAGYAVEELAGAGGMGVVYRAVDPELGRAVALKLIAPGYAEDAGRRELFVRESLMAAGLEHPNVIPVYRAGQDDVGRLYIAMRFVDGASLQELIREGGPLPAGRAARIVDQVAGALDAAHARGLVHRDVKPGNILIADPDGDEHVYLTDFGVSVHGASGGSGRSGGWTGTRDYLAPEQIRGGTLDARTDVYALGCVLFHALTGRPPFADRPPAATLIAHLTEPPPAPSALVPGLPPAMDAVVARAMAKRPEDRYATAGELGRAALAARHDAAVLHGPSDAGAAAAVAVALVDEGIAPTLVPGAEAGAAEAVRAAAGCAVLVGPDGLGDWAAGGLAAARDLASRDRAFHLVPVLLPGGPDPQDPSLAALGDHPWVDMRAAVADPLAVEDLARALAGPASRPGPAPPPDGTCPYRGLAAFREEDAAVFFGRESEVARLVALTADDGLVSVVGPSGSGKSSLVHAGLVPALRDASPPWRVVAFTPGADPLASIAAALRDLPGSGSPAPADLGADPGALAAALARARSGRADGERALVVVDQLEEAFTLCADEEVRAAALDAIVAAAAPGGGTTVVVTIRADLYGRLPAHPDLATLVAGRQMLVGPLGEDGLRRAIEEPARAAGLEIEPGLTRRIMNDVGDRPGTLPLLEHLLTELWRRRRGRTLTAEAYAASGGVEGALARRANEVYLGLDPERRPVARRTLLRLVAPGEGTEDTRRRATRRELTGDPAGAADVDAVIAAFAGARLLTTGRDPSDGEVTVEVAHEALIRGWPELRGWVDDDRESLRETRRLADASAEWHRAGAGDEGLLYRGARLAGWQERGRGDLTADEVSFLDASAAREQGERDARRRRTRIAIGALATALVVVGGVAAYAIVQRNDAADQRDVAESRQVAANARLQLTSDPELSLLLGQEALRIADTSEAETIVRQATHDSRVRSAFRAPVGVQDATYTPDGEIAWLADADGTVTEWRPDAGPIRSFDSGQGEVNSVEVTPDGETLVTGAADGSVRVWRTDGAPVTTLEGHQGAVYEVALTPDGATVVSAGEDGTVLVQPIGGGPARALRGHEGPVIAVAIDAAGRRVVSGGVDGTVRIRTLDGAAGPVLETGTLVIALDVSPDGRRVAIGDGSGFVRLWTPGTPAARPRVVRATPIGGVDSVAFSPDGSVVAAAASDASVRVWEADGTPLTTLWGHEAEMRSVAFSPDGASILSAGEDDTARVWAWEDGLATARVPEPADFAPDPGPVFLADGRSVVSVGFDGSLWRWDLRSEAMSQLSPGGIVGDYTVNADISADGTRYAVARPDGAIEVRAADGQGPPIVLPSEDAVTVGGLALSADGSALLAATWDGVVRLWDVDAGTARVIATGAGEMYSADLSPDGSTAVAAGADGVIRTWDVPTATLTASLRGHEAPVSSLAFDPSGERLLSGGADRSARIWDLGSGAARVLTGHQSDVRAEWGANGTRVVSASNDGVRVWDADTGAALLEIPSTSRDAYGGVLSPDGTTLVLQTLGAELQTYSCNTCGTTESVLDLAAGRATRELTEAEGAEFGID